MCNFLRSFLFLTNQWGKKLLYFAKITVKYQQLSPFGSKRSRGKRVVMTVFSTNQNISALHKTTGMAHEKSKFWLYQELYIAKDFRINMYEKYLIFSSWTILQSGQKWLVKTHAIFLKHTSNGFNKVLYFTYLNFSQTISRKPETPNNSHLKLVNRLFKQTRTWIYSCRTVCCRVNSCEGNPLLS